MQVGSRKERQRTAPPPGLAEYGTEYFRLALESTHDWEYWLNPQGRFIYCSPSCERITGYPPEKFLTSPGLLRRLLHPSDRAAHDEHEREHRRRRCSGECEWRIRHSDGTYRWVAHACQPVYDAAGKYLGHRGSNRDITDRKQVELALRASEERFRAIAANTPDHVLVQDRDLRYRLVVNPQLGFTEQQMLGKTDRDLVPAREAAILTRLKRRVLRTGKPVTMTLPVTWRGATQFFEGSYVPRRNDRGQVDGIIGYFRNVTDRRRAEQALKQINATLEQRVTERTAALCESEERFRQMAENVQEVFWLADANLTRMLYVSPAFETIWGRPCQSLYQNPKLWLQAVYPDDRALVHQAFIKHRTNSHPSLRAEYRIIRPDGTVRWIQDKGTRIFDARGRVYRITGVARDITAERRLQAEVQNISEAERQHLGRDLHDGLSQHLAAMSLLGDSLARTLRAKGIAHEPASQLALHAREAMTITHDLSRALYPASLKISGLTVALHELALLVRKMFPIHCQFCDGNVPRLADENLERQFFRIAQEAAFNAAKHSQGRHIWIRLRHNRHILTLTVRDDGIGVSPKQLATHDLGLNIMKYRAALIGATLAFDARPGHGTTITCQLRIPNHETRQETHLHR